MSDLQKVTNQEVEISGHKIKAWGLVKISKLSPAIDRIICRLKDQGATWEKYKEDIDNGTFTTCDKALSCIMPDAPEILSVSMGISIDEVDKLPQEEITFIIMTIIGQNITYIKNLYSRLHWIMQEARTQIDQK